MSAPDPVFPAELVNRDVAVRVAKALRDGDSFTVASVANQLDLAGALLSSLDLALASLALVSDATGVPLTPMGIIGQPDPPTGRTPRDWARAF